MKVRKGGGEEIPLVQGKEQRLCFAGAAVKRYPMSKAKLMSPRLRSGVAAERSYPTRSGAVAKRSNPTTKEQWLCGCRRARRATPHSRSGGATSSKVRSSSEEIPHVQGKRIPSKTVGVAKGHQRVDTLKP